MEENVWYDFFIETLYKKYPQKNQLIEALMNLLSIEREAVYRRLRKEVAFPSHEIAKIALEWDISLNQFVSMHAGNVSFVMKPINYFNPSKEEWSTIQERVQRIEHLKNSPNSECMEVCNRLPRSLTAGFPILYRFDNFRWAYQYGNIEGRPTLSKVVISKRIHHEIVEYYKLIKNIETMSYIWDYKIFEYLVKDILYFHSIHLVTDQEKEHLKKATLDLLDYLLEVATKGCFPETQKKVNLYISKVSIDSNYSYFYTDKLKVCRIHAFDKYDLFSYDTEMVNSFRAWMQLKKRTSIQISEVDERSRIEFFMNQRQAVNQL